MALNHMAHQVKAQPNTTSFVASIWRGPENNEGALKKPITKIAKSRAMPQSDMLQTFLCYI